MRRHDHVRTQAQILEIDITSTSKVGVTERPDALFTPSDPTGRRPTGTASKHGAFWLWAGREYSILQVIRGPRPIFQHRTGPGAQQSFGRLASANARSLVSQSNQGKCSVTAYALNIFSPEPSVDITRRSPSGYESVVRRRYCAKRYIIKLT